MLLNFRKVEKGGEDAFFISSYNGGVVAVADGVSGYPLLLHLLLAFPSNASILRL